MQQVSEAYLALANRGRRGNLRWILDREGKPAGPDSAAPGSGSAQVFSPETALQIMRFLFEPVARLHSFSRGGNLEYSFAVEVKTGTSEGHRDSWCVGVSDAYLVGVWMGNADFLSTKKLTGYEGTAVVVREMLFRLHPDRVDGQSDIDFPRPAGYLPDSICRLPGRRADRSTPNAVTEYFAPGTELLEFSQLQRLRPVDAANGLLAFLGCRARIQFRLFLDPEIPTGESKIAIQCRVRPPPAQVLWLWNGEEHKVLSHSFSLSWPMQPGRHRFQAVVPGTPFKSREIRLEVF